MVEPWDESDGPATGAAPNRPLPVMPSRLKLVVIGGPDRGREIDLAAGRHTIGKAPQCALLLSDGAVSRQHLELEVRSDGVVVRDLDSKNGSFYQGARFREVTVGVGAVIVAGESELALVAAAASPSLLPSSADHFGRLHGGSLQMREAFALLERVAPSNVPVLIEGETGTGKELAAEALHAASPRAKRPLSVCDLAGAPRALIESELFGHVRGAFTGADRDRVGAFVQADGGTLFLDEIGELELDLQPRLLRALEEKKVKPVGTSSYTKVDVRVVAATNRDLREEVKAGRFREDLYHRLAVVRVKLPPLRERKEDIVGLVAQLLDGTDATIPPETMALLQAYDWPGNVRELRNLVDRGRALMDRSGTLFPSLLGLEIAPTQPAPEAATGPRGYHEAREKLLGAWEREFVTQVLQRTGGNVSRAAREAGIDRVYLHRLMKKHRVIPDGG
jgi:DNA-binding NtrC family response regulator